MKFLSALIVVLLGFSTQAHALINIAVTSVQSDGGAGGTPFDLNVSFVITSWSTSDATAINCGRWQCTLSYRVVFDDGTSTGFGLGLVLPGSTTGLTLGRFLQSYQRLNGFVIPSSHSTRMISAELLRNPCFAIVNSDTLFGGIIVSNCVPLTSAAVRCDISGNTTIDHKTLLDSALNGAQASTKLNVKCNASASVSVRATRTNSYGVSLRNDDSLYSVVTVNNRDSTNGIDMSVTGNLDSPLNITSTLVTRGAVAPGPFSGSTVITVTPN